MLSAKREKLIKSTAIDRNRSQSTAIDSHSGRFWATVLIIALFLWVAPATAQTPIPPSKIATLTADLEKGLKTSSIVNARRACKSVIRKGKGLMASAPEAPNRYAVLDVIFHAQKKLLGMEPIDRNREALFETCSQLMKAPDDYAELRFDADMILSERDHAINKSPLAQRIDDLEKTLARYRGTKAEWRSLMVASHVAPKLLAFDLERDVYDTISERFGGDHNALKFLRSNPNGGPVEAVFSGTYKSADGTILSFPSDRLGHQYLIVFWSKNADGYEDFLGKIKTQQTRFPNRVEVYSFNLDELPDAGAKILQGKGIDCMAMHLPGGREHSAFPAYAKMDLVVQLVNPQGKVLLKLGQRIPWPGPPTRVKKGETPGPGPGVGIMLDNDRYLAQLQYFYNGDFLIDPTDKQAEGIPENEWATIQACFTEVPYRYRLTSEELLANYQKAETLCAAAIKAHSQATDIWKIRNRRIIALIGMWNLARKPAYLSTAVEEGNALLASTIPEGADTVARFSLTKTQLRNQNRNPEALLREFVTSSGEGEPSDKTLAAAAILALEANAKTYHQSYRQKLLASPNDDKKALWPVYAFLRNRHHRFRNFHASPGGYHYNKILKYEYRNMVGGLVMPLARDFTVSFDLQTIGGEKVSISDAADGNMVAVLFVEPPADEDAQIELVADTSRYVGTFEKVGVKVLVACLTTDPEAMNKLKSETYELLQVPDGLANPIVKRLGILSADRIANSVLFRSDGTVAWFASGVSYYTKWNPYGTYARTNAIPQNVEKLRSDKAFEALEKGEWEMALKQFDAYLGPKDKSYWSRDFWAADRHQGRALAYAAQKDWTQALTAINAALDQRRADFKSGMCKCHGVVEMHLTKATILDKLGKPDEAEKERQEASSERLPHAALPAGIARQGVPVGVYYDWLKQLRLKILGNKNQK